ncbi:MAG: tyrosine--tRNA ligase, partial [Anaerolineales bacterium]|nr:tyrosine--tRNA ligase [Anaerolineales bacterium]
YGVTLPLIQKADGTKFGKTEAGTVWLDEKRTSVYQFYQFWINTDDRDVLGYLKLFTWLTQEDIADLADKHAQAPHKREAHLALAKAMTNMVHGETALQKAEQATAVLFGGSLDGLDSDDIADIFAEVPANELPRQQIADGLNIIDLLADTTVASGKGDAKRAVQGGGMYLNNERIGDINQTVTLDDTIEGRFLVLRKGKKKYHLVKLI